MEYQKIVNLVDNTSNQSTKFWTKNWVGINNDASGTYNKDIQIKYKTSMLKSSLCDYRNTYIFVSRTIKVATETDAAPNNVDKIVVFKNCAPFTDCISEINNTQIDKAKDIEVVMTMCNLIEYSDNYSKTAGSLWQYHRDEPALTNAGATAKTGKIAAGGTENVKIMVPLKYLSNFWRTFEVPLVNREINFILTWSEKCVLSYDTKETTFEITDTKLYVPAVTL